MACLVGVAAMHSECDPLSYGNSNWSTKLNRNGVLVWRHHDISLHYNQSSLSINKFDGNKLEHGSTAKKKNNLFIVLLVVNMQWKLLAEWEHYSTLPSSSIPNQVDLQSWVSLFIHTCESRSIRLGDFAEEYSEKCEGSTNASLWKIIQHHTMPEPAIARPRIGEPFEMSEQFNFMIFFSVCQSSSSRLQ